MFVIWSNIAKGYLTELGWTADKTVAKKFTTQEDCEKQIYRLVGFNRNYKICKI